jgi:protease-4
LKYALYQEEWGAPRRIALVYAIGACALDTGIRARWLERTLLGLARDPSVAAVVLRVDSPGGYGLASDLVATAIEKCRDTKPVIVSQGQVAASGGYWISMNADRIVAGPTTVTGSIGVIGGWVYDAGLSEKLGMSSDHVQRGAHGDFASGIRLPLIGRRVPARNLTEEERSIVEAAIREHYADFVRKVAHGRGMSEEQVERIAQGRFYSGLDGQAHGLVDDLGNLLFALDLARDRAAITASEPVQIVEYPRVRGLFRWPGQSRLPTLRLATDPVVEAIEMLLDARGRPLPLLVPGSYPSVD